MGLRQPLFQKLGEWICLLGGKLDFVARPREGRPRMWTPEYLNLQESVRGILTVSVESEKRRKPPQGQMMISVPAEVFCRIMLNREWLELRCAGFRCILQYRGLLLPGTPWKDHVRNDCR